MAQSSGHSQSPGTLPQPGKVNEIVQEWLYKEDDALARRLQTEEIADHCQRNRQRNGVLRHDVPHVRYQQQLEDAVAASSWQRHQLQLLEQSSADAETARRLAAEDMLQAAEQRRRQELQDEQLARQLVERDRQRRRQQRERKQVDEEARMLGLESGLSSLTLGSSASSSQVDPAAELDSGAAAGGGGAGGATGGEAAAAYSDNDLSDFQAPPPSALLLSEDDYRSWQEQQDEEVAMFLQEQDAKRRGGVMPREKQVAIEAQDRELAKVLQEQERARLRRARQRAREKRRQRRDQEQLRMAHSPELVCDVVTVHSNCPASDDNDDDDDVSGAEPSWQPVPSPPAVPTAAPPAAAAGGADTYTRRPVGSHFEQLHRPELTSHTVSDAVPYGVSNIAAMIDPTYRRQTGSSSTALPSSAVPSPASHSHCQPHLLDDNVYQHYNTASNSSSHHLPATATALEQHTPKSACRRAERGGEERVPEFVPPYMPLQGQRRATPTAAQFEQKFDKQRRSRDHQGCKHQ